MKKNIGSFAWKLNNNWKYGSITEIDSVYQDETFDKEGNRLTDKILIARYETENMLGRFNQLIKLNVTRNLIYFLTEKSFNGEIDFPEFETRGFKGNINV